MLMSTALLMRSIANLIWFISLMSGPRTAATMQNSVAPVAAVSLAALTSSGMSSQTERTGEANWPDWVQKWQSSGQPPVLIEMMPSTSTDSPQYFTRTSCARASASGTASSGSSRIPRIWASPSPTPPCNTCVRACSRMGAPALAPDGSRVWSVGTVVVICIPLGTLMWRQPSLFFGPSAPRGHGDQDPAHIWEHSVAPSSRRDGIVTTFGGRLPGPTPQFPGWRAGGGPWAPTERSRRGRHPRAGTRWFELGLERSPRVHPQAARLPGGSHVVHVQQIL